jgi:hypothetical protein
MAKGRMMPASLDFGASISSAETPKSRRFVVEKAPPREMLGMTQ